MQSGSLPPEKAWVDELFDIAKILKLIDYQQSAYQPHVGNLIQNRSLIPTEKNPLLLAFKQHIQNLCQREGCKNFNPSRFFSVYPDYLRDLFRYLITQLRYGQLDGSNRIVWSAPVLIAMLEFQATLFKVESQEAPQGNFQEWVNKHSNTHPDLIKNPPLYEVLLDKDFCQRVGIELDTLRSFFKTTQFKVFLSGLAEENLANDKFPRKLELSIQLIHLAQKNYPDDDINFVTITDLSGEKLRKLLETFSGEDYLLLIDALSVFGKDSLVEKLGNEFLVKKALTDPEVSNLINNSNAEEYNYLTFKKYALASIDALKESSLADSLKVITETLSSMEKFQDEIDYEFLARKSTLVKSLGERYKNKLQNITDDDLENLRNLFQTFPLSYVYWYNGIPNNFRENISIPNDKKIEMFKQLILLEKGSTRYNRENVTKLYPVALNLLTNNFLENSPLAIEEIKELLNLFEINSNLLVLIFESDDYKKGKYAKFLEVFYRNIDEAWVEKFINTFEPYDPRLISSLLEKTEDKCMLNLITKQESLNFYTILLKIFQVYPDKISASLQALSPSYLKTLGEKQFLEIITKQGTYDSLLTAIKELKKFNPHFLQGRRIVDVLKALGTEAMLKKDNGFSDDLLKKILEELELDKHATYLRWFAKDITLIPKLDELGIEVPGVLEGFRPKNSAKVLKKSYSKTPQQVTDAAYLVLKDAIEFKNDKIFTETVKSLRALDVSDKEIKMKLKTKIKSEFLENPEKLPLIPEIYFASNVTVRALLTETVLENPGKQSDVLQTIINEFNRQYRYDKYPESLKLLIFIFKLTADEKFTASQSFSDLLNDSEFRDKIKTVLLKTKLNDRELKIIEDFLKLNAAQPLLKDLRGSLIDTRENKDEKDLDVVMYFLKFPDYDPPGGLRKLIFKNMWLILYPEYQEARKREMNDTFISTKNKNKNILCEEKHFLHQDGVWRAAIMRKVEPTSSQNTARKPKTYDFYFSGNGDCLETNSVDMTSDLNSTSRYNEAYDATAICWNPPCVLGSKGKITDLAAYVEDSCRIIIHHIHQLMGDENLSLAEASQRVCLKGQSLGGWLASAIAKNLHEKGYPVEFFNQRSLDFPLDTAIWMSIQNLSGKTDEDREVAYRNYQFILSMMQTNSPLQGLSGLGVLARLRNRIFHAFGWYNSGHENYMAIPEDSRKYIYAKNDNVAVYPASVAFAHQAIHEKQRETIDKAIKAIEDRNTFGKKDPFNKKFWQRIEEINQWISQELGSQYIIPKNFNEAGLTNLEIDKYIEILKLLEHVKFDAIAFTATSSAHNDPTLYLNNNPCPENLETLGKDFNDLKQSNNASQFYTNLRFTRLKHHAYVALEQDIQNSIQSFIYLLTTDEKKQVETLIVNIANETNVPQKAAYAHLLLTKIKRVNDNNFNKIQVDLAKKLTMYLGNLSDDHRKVLEKIIPDYKSPMQSQKAEQDLLIDNAEGAGQLPENKLAANDNIINLAIGVIKAYQQKLLTTKKVTETNKQNHTGWKRAEKYLTLLSSKEDSNKKLVYLYALLHENSTVLKNNIIQYALHAKDFVNAKEKLDKYFCTLKEADLASIKDFVNDKRKNITHDNFLLFQHEKKEFPGLDELYRKILAGEPKLAPIERFYI